MQEKKFYSKNERKVTSSLLKIEIRAHVRRCRQSSGVPYKNGRKYVNGRVPKRLVGRNFFGYKKRDPPCDTLLSFGQLRFQAFSRSLHSISQVNKSNKILYFYFSHSKLFKHFGFLSLVRFKKSPCKNPIPFVVAISPTALTAIRERTNRRSKVIARFTRFRLNFERIYVTLLFHLTPDSISPGSRRLRCDKTAGENP